MLALAERLPKDRFRVDFLAMSGSGPDDERALAVGARVRHLGQPPRPGASLPERFIGRVAKTARYVRAARAGRYDVIDAWLYPVDVMAALARPLTRAPIVVTGRYNLRDFTGHMSRPERWLNTQANRMVDAVVANADAVAADTLAHETIDARKLRVIRNGVDPIPPMPGDEVAARRRELGIADDEVVFGSVANLHPVKRHDLLIDAFAVLRREGLAVRLVMIGGGTLQPELQRRIDAHGMTAAAHLLGGVPNARSMLGAFDVVVQASRSEGLPNALLEAAAAGRAIVATAAGGTGEVVEDGVTGLLVPVNDLDALAGAMRRLATDSDLRRRLGDAARRRADTEFTMERFVGDYAALYEELATARGIRP